MIRYIASARQYVNTMYEYIVLLIPGSDKVFPGTLKWYFWFPKILIKCSREHLTYGQFIPITKPARPPPPLALLCPYRVIFREQ